MIIFVAVVAEHDILELEMIALERESWDST